MGTVNIDRNLIFKVMSDSKTYVFDSGANQNSLLASILPALQNKGIDSSYLMGLMSGNNNGGFFGNNGGFQDIIALIVIAAIFGNGNFGFGGFGNNGGGANLVASTAEREMLLSAIQRNGVDISQLASSLNCSVGRLDDAIGHVATQICNLTGQLGMSSQQIINSVQAGNATLASQIASCCCDLKSALASCCCDIKQGISESNYLTERGFCTTNQILARGFSDIGYASAQQTCELKGAIKDSTDRIIDGQRAAEMRALTDKIDALREKNSEQAVVINNAQQTATFSQMLNSYTAPISAAVNALQTEVASVKCRLPETVTLPYSCATAVPTNLLYNGFVNYGTSPYPNTLWG